MAASAAQRPGPTITRTMGTPGEREGAFRFLESKRGGVDELASAVYETSALDCAACPFVFVAVDQTSLRYVDRKGVRGLGPDDNREVAAIRGAQVMSSLAMDETGVPIGLLDQQWWTRPEEKSPPASQDTRPPEEREPWAWVRSMEAVSTRLKTAAPNTRPWFLMDRGADFHGALHKACDEGHLVTVRANYPRRIRRNSGNKKVWACVSRQPVLGHVSVKIPGSSRRRARVARFELRAIRGNVKIRNKAHGEAWSQLSCVRVREVSHVPLGETRIEWKLLSTFEVNNLADAQMVLKSYTLRWRIEEFHKTWKSGACKVEESQLRSLGALRRWATILAAVAVRIERLKRLSREQPDLDALEEFSQDEIDASILLTRTKNHERGDSLTLQQAVRLVAMIGGYMGRKSDGPPGSITIRRGLEQVRPAALAFAATRTSG